ncbi:MAG: peptide ABC transporter substrate-binding protein [Phycisphaerales bacterium]|nr:MAG: peptide ABC transporter substrate-binding protein [Phycisphaerales bacterium]
MRLLPLPILLLVIAALVLWWDDPAPEADLTIISRGDAFTLDPQRMTYLRDFRIAFSLYEGLVRWENRDFSILPAAADSLPERSGDGRQYTFTISRDARWSNGDPVTAHDFHYSAYRALLPETASYYTSVFYVVEGAREFLQWRADRLERFAGDSGPDAGAAAALWRETKARFRDTVGIEVLDDHTIRYTLNQPTPYVLELMCLPIFMPVHRPTVEGWRLDDQQLQRVREAGWHAVDPPGFAQRARLNLNHATGRVQPKHDWAKVGMLVTNGPLALDRWRFQREMRLEMNPHYHRPEMVRSRSVLINVIDDANTAVLAFASGVADWLPDVGVGYQPDMLAQRAKYVERHASQLAALEQEGLEPLDAVSHLPPPARDERRDLHQFPAFGVDFYSFNCRPELPNGRANPFAEAAVRRAFVQSVNRETIVRQVTRLNEPVLTSLIPRNAIPGYRNPEGLGYDSAQARRELEEAGWIDRNGDGVRTNEVGDAFPTVEILWTTNTPRYRWISLELKSQWERELGVRVELRGVDTRFYREDLRTGNFMIARGTWYGDFGDPVTFLNLCRSDDGNNHRRFASAYVDDLLDRAAAERDPEARFRLLEKCEAHLFQNEVPMLVICQLTQTQMFDPARVRGISSHPRMVQYFWQVEVTGE